MAQNPPGPVLRAIGDPGFCGSRRRSGIVWQWHLAVALCAKQVFQRAAPGGALGVLALLSVLRVRSFAAARVSLPFVTVLKYSLSEPH